jgi:cell division protein FtsW
LLRHASIPLCLAVAVLCVIGMVMMASTSAWVPGMENPHHFLTWQAVYLGLGCCAGLVAIFFPIDWLRRLAPCIWLLAVILLVLCFIPGIGIEHYGSKRWVRMPIAGQFQPSEMAKIALVIAMAAWYARWVTEIPTFLRGFVVPSLIAAIPVLLILGETDAGTALALAAAAGALMFCIGSRLLYLLPSTAAGITAAYLFLRSNPNRWARIQAWLDLDNPDPSLTLGINMQQLRALIAYGNGGVHGVGPGNGVEKFGTLTLAHSDFILPVIGEEFGLLGTLGVVLCFVVIALAGGAIALRARNTFHRGLAVGLTCILVVPAIMHIGVTTAWMPNDGVPLPFVSYGGTSIIFSLAAVGLLLAVHRASCVEVPEVFPLGPERPAVRL